MTTGSLKFLSLIVVIAAGGGVAWQAQKGILHPQNSTAGADDTDDSDDASLDFGAEPDAGPTLSDPDDDPEKETRRPARRIAATSWNDDSDSGHQHHAAAAPGKFQRSQAKSKSLGSTIPARRRVEPPPEDPEESPSGPTLAVHQDDAAEGDDPFAAQEPPPKLKPTRDRPLAPVADHDDSSDADDSTGPAMRTASDSPESDADEPDPFEKASPLILVGNEDLPGDPDEAESPKMEDGFPGEAEPDAEPAATDSADDPFAGSAPSDFGEAPAEDEKSTPDRVAFPREEPVAQDTTPAREPSRRGAGDARPGRTPTRRTPPKDEIEDAFDAGSKPDDAFPKPSLPTEIPDEASGDDDAPRLPEEKVPARRRRSTTSDEPAAEKAPNLLPVPDPSGFGGTPPGDDEPAGRTGFDDDPAPPEMPASQPEDLSGDATPDHAAPKGLQQPRLTIEKVAPKQAVLGQPLVYSVIVKNAGSAAAHQVTVEDRIPKGTKLEGTSPRAELIDKRLIWRLGTLQPDEQKKISIKLIPQEQGPIGSVARVNFVAEIAAEIEVTAPQILLSVDAPSQVRLGDKLHLSFKVRNAGRADAENVVVRNLIPEGLRHPAGADLEYAVGTLPAGESREIKLDLVATKNGKVRNKTVITGDGIQLEEETPVEVIGEQLLLTRTGKNRLFIDKPALFTTTVANEGTAAAAKVMVAEVIPAGFDYVAASDNGKFDPATRAVTWSIGPLGPGEELKLSTKLMPKSRGDFRATVTVTGPAGSVATVESDMKIEGFPAVAVDSKSDTRLISVGEKATIRIQCKNQGTAPAKNLILSAELPPELRLVDGKGSVWAHQGNVITFEAIESLDPNATTSFEIQVEGLTEGDTRIELQISADHLKRPLHRDETIRVAPEAE